MRDDATNLGMDISECVKKVRPKELLTHSLHALARERDQANSTLMGRTSPWQKLLETAKVGVVELIVRLS
jgi:hypothetical protein